MFERVVRFGVSPVLFWRGLECVLSSRGAPVVGRLTGGMHDSMHLIISLNFGLWDVEL